MSLGYDSYEEALEARREWERRSKPLKRKSRLSRNTRLSPVNRERKEKRRERDFGDKADWVREQPCDTCGAPDPSDPSHYPSRGAGGRKEDLLPMCRDCHDKMSAPGWGVERLLDSIGKTKAWLVGRTEYWEERWQEVRDE